MVRYPNWREQSPPARVFVFTITVFSAIRRPREVAEKRKDGGQTSVPGRSSCSPHSHALKLSTHGSLNSGLGFPFGKLVRRVREVRMNSGRSKGRHEVKLSPVMNWSREGLFIRAHKHLLDSKRARERTLAGQLHSLPRTRHDHGLPVHPEVVVCEVVESSADPTACFAIPVYTTRCYLTRNICRCQYDVGPVELESSILPRRVKM